MIVVSQHQILSICSNLQMLVTLVLLHVNYCIIPMNQNQNVSKEEIHV